MTMNTPNHAGPQLSMPRRTSRAIALAVTLAACWIAVPSTPTAATGGVAHTVASKAMKVDPRLPGTHVVDGRVPQTSSGLDPRPDPELCHC